MAWIRSILVFAILFFSSQPANAQKTKSPFLILIEPLRAGPNIRPQDYVHDTWIHWPEGTRFEVGNQLLSLVTGIDWLGQVQDYDFRPLKNGGWRAGNLKELLRRGHFEAKEQALGMPTLLVKSSTGNVTRNGMLLALGTDGVVNPLPFLGPFPNGVVLIGEASSWDDVAAWRSQTDGKVLVIEYPPPKDQKYSRVWLMGKGWTDPESGTTDRLPAFDAEGGVPGLIPAKRVASVLNDGPLNWNLVPRRGWEGANRWFMAYGATALNLRGLYCILGMILAAWGARLLNDERRSQSCLYCIVAYLLLPVVALVAGNLCRWGGLEGALTWYVVATLGITTMVAVVEIARRKWLEFSHPLTSVAIVCLATTLMVDPTYSIFSPVFRAIEDGYLQPMSGSALGILLTSLVVLQSTTKRYSSAKWWFLGVTVALVLVGMKFGPWWGRVTHVGGEYAMPAAFIAAYLAGLGYLRPGFFMILGLSTGIVSTVLNHGTTLHYNGLSGTQLEAVAFDFGPLVRLLMSSTIWISMTQLGFGWLTANGFASHFVRRVFGQSEVVQSLAYMSGTLLLTGLARAYLFEAGVVAGFAAVAILFFESIRTV